MPSSSEHTSSVSANSGSSEKSGKAAGAPEAEKPAKTSCPIWNAKEGKGGNARVEEEKKVERKRKKNGNVGMGLKEEEDERDGEEGEGHGIGQAEQNGNLNLSQCDTLKKMRSKKKEEGIPHISESVASTAGHWDCGEKSGQHVGQGLRKRKKVAGDNDARENLSRPVQDGTREATTNLPKNEDNLAQHVPNDMVMTDQQEQMFDQVRKENLTIFNSQLVEILDRFQKDIVNIVNAFKKDLQGSSNNARATRFDHFSTIKGFSSARELPPLSKAEAEMLDQKWLTQAIIEEEVATKHLTLMLEEYQLLMSKSRHQ